VKNETWQKEFSIETEASAETIWKLFQDVPGWRQWNAGIESIEIDGPFAQGTWFSMTPPGEETLRSLLIDVRENECFVDETRVGELVVRVAHRIERLGLHRSRVTYAVDAQGQEAAVVGPMVAADFPEVLSALAVRAETLSQRTH